MKTRGFTAVIVALALASSLYAQDEPAISAPKNQSQGNNVTVTKQINPGTTESVKPGEGVRGTGLIYEMSDKGLVIISPTAPASLGYGTINTSIPPGTIIYHASNAVNQNDRIVDGIPLIGWEW